MDDTQIILSLVVLSGAMSILAGYWYYQASRWRKRYGNVMTQLAANIYTMVDCLFSR